MKFTNIQWKIQSPFYVRFRKHYCPKCNLLLDVVKESKIVYPESGETVDFSFSARSPRPMGPVKVIWNEFECPSCKDHFSIEQMKQIENVL